jgi:hypothetical protein
MQVTGWLILRAAKSISDKLLGAKSFVRLAVTSTSRTRGRTCKNEAVGCKLTASRGSVTGRPAEGTANRLH